MVARVERIERDSESDVAVLRVIETWKGPVSDLVRVHLQGGVHCPAPPRYVEGREVLAFLESPLDESLDDVFLTVGRSYGVLYPEVEERQDFLRLVERIQVETSPLAPSFERDWHVEATMRRATRWHGLTRLVPRADEVHRFFDPARGRVNLFELLSTEDREKIARGFLEDPSSDVTFPMTLEVLHGFESAEIDTIAVALLKGLLLGSRPPWTAQSIAAVLNRFGNSESLIRLWFPAKPDSVFHLLSKGHYDGRLQKFWASAARELGIPDVEPFVLYPER